MPPTDGRARFVCRTSAGSIEHPLPDDPAMQARLAEFFTESWGELMPDDLRATAEWTIRPALPREELPDDAHT